MKTMLAVLYYLISALCIVYGITIMAAGTGTTFFMIWYGLGVLALLLGISARMGLWQLLPVIIRRIFLGCLACLLILFLLVEGLIISEFRSRPEEDLDYIIVLGAFVTRDGPKPVLLYRLLAAKEYLEGHPGTICILSGGQGKNEPASEASVMRDYLIRNGIEPSRLLLEDQSLNTRQNLIYSSKLIDPDHDHIGIVTNNFHLFRAIHLAKGVGIRHISGIAAGSNPRFLPNNMLREFLAVCKDGLAGNLK
ncbi:MAG: YdcF family protein [Eubacterium sp.]|nr:YdcF family protein [Eubacterium sp.]